MVSSAKHSPHGLVRSLDSSYSSLTASAVGADRFWQIDQGIRRFARRAVKKSRIPRSQRPFANANGLFVVLLASRQAIAIPVFSRYPHLPSALIIYPAYNHYGTNFRERNFENRLTAKKKRTEARDKVPSHWRKGSSAFPFWNGLKSECGTSHAWVSHAGTQEDAWSRELPVFRFLVGGDFPCWILGPRFPKYQSIHCLP